MELFLTVSLSSIVGYAFCVWCLISLSSKSHISKGIVHTRVFVQYLCSLLLVTAIASCMLHYQVEGEHIMSTRNDASFILDLMVLVFLASILIAFNIKFIRSNYSAIAHAGIIRT